MSFHELLKQFRKEKNITQKALCEKTGISHSYITLLEKGRRMPRRDKILKISAALKLNEEETNNLLLSAGQVSQDVGLAVEKIKIKKELFIKRENYHILIGELVDMARKEVVYISPSQHTSEEEPSQEYIIKAKKKAIERKVRYRGILPKDPTRIRTAQEHFESGEDIRLHREVRYTDLIFTIIDKKTAVVATQIDPYEKEDSNNQELSRMGFVTHSKILIRLLLEYFDNLWISATDFKSYLQEILSNMKKENLSEETIEKRMGFSPSKLENNTKLSKE